MKNARGHTPYDLATTDETRKLIEKANKTLTCGGKNCGGSRFDFKNVRFLCESCGNFFAETCCWRGEYYENEQSEQKERPVCFCIGCLQNI